MKTIQINGAEYPLIDATLPWQKRGLQETASGYGSRLTTSKKVLFQGVARRIYAICYGNSASCYIRVNGQKVFVH